jgi:hypothetical protein
MQSFHPDIDKDKTSIAIASLGLLNVFHWYKNECCKMNNDWMAQTPLSRQSSLGLCACRSSGFVSKTMSANQSKRKPLNCSGFSRCSPWEQRNVYHRMIMYSSTMTSQKHPSLPSLQLFEGLLRLGQFFWLRKKDGLWKFQRRRGCISWTTGWIWMVV